MKSDLAELLKSIYIDGQTELFIRGCSNTPVFFNDLVEELKEMSDEVVIFNSENLPTEQINIHVNTADADGIVIEYVSVLYVNKLVNCFYLQHEIEMHTPDRDVVEPFPDDYRCEPYNKKQLALEEMLVRRMTALGYRRLTFDEMEEVFPTKLYSTYWKREKYYDVRILLFDDYLVLTEDYSVFPATEKEEL